MFRWYSGQLPNQEVINRVRNRDQVEEGIGKFPVYSTISESPREVRR